MMPRGRREVLQFCAIFLVLGLAWTVLWWFFVR